MTTPNQNDPYQNPPAGARQPGPPPGYPQASQMPAAAPYVGAPLPAPTVMPGKTKAARIMIFVASGVLGLISLLNLLATVGDPEEYERQMKDALGAEVSASAFSVVYAIFLLYAVVGVILAARFGSGGNGVRVGALVWAGLGIVFGLVSLPVGLVTLVLAILTIVFLAKTESAAWFTRPRQ